MTGSIPSPARKSKFALESRAPPARTLPSPTFSDVASIETACPVFMPTAKCIFRGSPIREEFRLPPAPVPIRGMVESGSIRSNRSAAIIIPAMIHILR